MTDVEHLWRASHSASVVDFLVVFFFFSSRRRHTRSVSAFLLNRSSDLLIWLDLPPSPTKSSNLSETAEVPACNVPSRSPLPALAIAPETKLGTASSGLGTLEP